MKTITKLILCLVFLVGGATAQLPNLEEYRLIHVNNSTAYAVQEKSVGVGRTPLFTLLMAHVTVRDVGMIGFNPDNYLVLRMLANCTTNRYTILSASGIVAGKPEAWKAKDSLPLTPQMAPVLDFVCKPKLPEGE